MYLVIDWGNSRLKYLLVEKLTDETISASKTQLHYADSVADLKKQISQSDYSRQIHNALIGSVKSEKHNQQLEKMLGNAKIPCFFAQTTHSYPPIKLSYKNPEKMGVDRWLALVASFENKRSIGIIDLGTAITVDLIDKYGTHLGGHIVPGSHMLRNSLLKTDKVRLERPIFEERSNQQNNDKIRDKNYRFGQSTQTCVDFGIDYLLASYLSHLISRAFDDFGIVGWYITGGDSQEWFEYLSSDIYRQFSPDFILSPKLIFQGLSKLYHQHLN